MTNCCRRCKEKRERFDDRFYALVLGRRWEEHIRKDPKFDLGQRAPRLLEMVV